MNLKPTDTDINEMLHSIAGREKLDPEDCGLPPVDSLLVGTDPEPAQLAAHVLFDAWWGCVEALCCPLSHTARQAMLDAQRHALKALMTMPDKVFNVEYIDNGGTWHTDWTHGGLAAPMRPMSFGEAYPLGHRTGRRIVKA